MADPGSIISLAIDTGRLARKVYKRFKQAPSKYRKLREEAENLKDALEDVQELIEDHALQDLVEQKLLRQPDFETGIRECQDILHELNSYLDSLLSLETSKAKAIDRFRLDDDTTDALREQLKTRTLFLTFKVNAFNATASVRILLALSKILEQMRLGHLDAKSVRSFSQVGQVNDDEALSGITTIFEEHDIDDSTVFENKDLILTKLRDAKRDGIIPELAQSGDEEDAAVVNSPSSITDGGTSDNSGSEYETEVLEQQSWNGDSAFGSASSRSGHRLSMHSNGHRLKVGYDGSHLPVSPANSFLSLWGTIGKDIKRQVMQGCNTLDDDIMRAKEYWSRENWPACKGALLRILSASELPRYQRPHLNSNMVGFLLGIVSVYSGNLQMAKNTFLKLLLMTDPSGSARRVASSTSPPSTSPSHVRRANVDAHIAAAIWLGDVCLMLNKQEDSVLAYCFAIKTIRAKMADSMRRTSQSRQDSSVTDTTLVTSLTRDALASNSRTTSVDGRPFLEQMLTTEMSLTNDELGHVDHLLTKLMQGIYIDEGSVFAAYTKYKQNDLLHLVNEAFNSGDYLTRETPLRATYKQALSKSQKLKPADKFSGAPDRSTIIEKHAATHSLELPSLIKVDGVLSVAAYSTEWPLILNPSFSHLAAVYCIEWFHHSTTIPGEDATYNILETTASELRSSLGFPSPSDLHAVHSNRDVHAFAVKLRQWLSEKGVDYVEKPSHFRCKPAGNKPSDLWPGVACFAIRLVKVKQVVGRTKLGAYACDAVHWDGSTASSLKDCRVAKRFSLGWAVDDAIRDGRLGPLDHFGQFNGPGAA